MKYYYDADYTGVAQDNKIVDERHTLTLVNSQSYHFIIPRFAPFFLDSLRLHYYDSNGKVYLVKNVDWSAALLFQGASYVSGQSIYGGITLLNRNISGNVFVSYQTLGGPYTFNSHEITTELADIIYNPGGVTWEDVLNKPIVFSTVDHKLPFETIVGLNDVNTRLNTIKTNILNKIYTDISSHVNDLQNPHHTDKEDIGLGLVENYAVATEAEAIAGTSSTTLITAYTLTKTLEHYGLGNVKSIVDFLKGHLRDYLNPHELTKTQTSLGSVENLPTASLEEVLGKEKVKKYVTLDNLILYLSLYGCKPKLDEEQSFAPLGSLLSVYCDNFDRYGVYSDGAGGTTTDIIQTNSRDCGYEDPNYNTQYLEAGAILGRYCLGVDQYGRFADGQGGNYDQLITTNSVACGYVGPYPGDGGNIKSGTLIATNCDGENLVKTYADGEGGSYTKIEKNAPECTQGMPAYPAAGTSLGTYCDGFNLKERYADGKGGSFAIVVITNAGDCGYMAAEPPEPPPPPAPPAQPPSIIPPAPPAAGPVPPDATPGDSSLKYVEVYKGNNCEVGTALASYDSTTQTLVITGENVYNGILYDVHEAYTGVWNKINTIRAVVAKNDKIIFTGVTPSDFSRAYRFIGNDHCISVNKSVEVLEGLGRPSASATATFNYNDLSLVVRYNSLTASMPYRIYVQENGAWTMLSNIAAAYASADTLTFYNLVETDFQKPMRFIGSNNA